MEIYLFVPPLPASGALVRGGPGISRSASESAIARRLHALGNSDAPRDSN